MMADEALAAQLADTIRAIAVKDLEAIDGFFTAMATGTFTVDTFIAAFGSLPDAMTDGDRQKQFANFFGQFQQTLGAVREVRESTARSAAA